MSFIKIQKIDPASITPPESGNIYLGQDDKGLWELDEYGNITHIQSGITYLTLVTGSTSSGTSGVNGTFGTSGIDGGDGTAGTSGKSGLSGTSGTSGIGSSGTGGKTGSSGSSGYTGTSGFSGSSGSSGIDGNFYGSSGTSGYSGGYGGASRVWQFSTLSLPPAGTFWAGNDTYPGNYSLSLVNKLKISTSDLDSQLEDNWLNTWVTGTLKIESKSDASIFGIYNLSLTSNTKPTITVNLISGFTNLTSNGNLVLGEDYFISFIQSGVGGAGTSGSSGKDGQVIGIDYYLDDILSDLSGTTYELNRWFPVKPENDDFVTITGSTSEKYYIQSYITEIDDPKINLIPAGLWKFHSYGYIDGPTPFSSNHLVADIYARTTGGTETLISTIQSADIQSDDPLNPTESDMEYYTTSGITVNLNDRIILKVFGISTYTGRVNQLLIKI
jgi:hypothetical protein